jgi:hypothetical protein
VKSPTDLRQISERPPGNSENSEGLPSRLGVSEPVGAVFPPIALGVSKLNRCGDAPEPAPQHCVAGETIVGAEVPLSGPPPLSPPEGGDGGQNPLAAPCLPLAPAAESPEGRVVKVRIISMPARGAATMELPGGKGLSAVVPRDGGTWNSQL